MFRMGQNILRPAIGSRLASLPARLGRDERGTTAIEFALVALPFFALIFGTMALGIWYLDEASVDLAVSASARQLMNGVAQANPTVLSSPAAFSTQVLCPNMPSYVACSATNPSVSINVVPADFGTLLRTVPVTDPKAPAGSMSMPTLIHQKPATCSPSQGEVVYIQVAYTIPALNAVYAVFGGSQILSGTTVKVEQFPTSDTDNFSC